MPTLTTKTNKKAKETNDTLHDRIARLIFTDEQLTFQTENSLTPSELWKSSGINPSTTLEEEYIHAVHTLGENCSDVYDHEVYLECKKTMSITGEFGIVEEPSTNGLILTMLVAVVVALVITRGF